MNSRVGSNKTPPWRTGSNASSGATARSLQRTGSASGTYDPSAGVTSRATQCCSRGQQGLPRPRRAAGITAVTELVDTICSDDAVSQGADCDITPLIGILGG